MAKHAARREAFRAVLAGAACVRPASVHDPISARIAQELGFETGMFAGSVASLTVLGAPDLILLTLSEFADQARRIGRASDLPLLADADHGYGDALNVMRTVEELEAAGIAGVSIEDTALPRGYGADGPTFISVEEGVGKMRAALEARADPRLVIAGRTSAAGSLGPAEARRRVSAYAQAGVDAIFLVGVKTRADLEMIVQGIDKPFIVGGGGPELSDAEALAALGVRIALQGHHPFAAAVQAIYATMAALREGTPPQELTGLADAETMARLMRRAQHDDWTERFLTDEA